MEAQALSKLKDITCPDCNGALRPNGSGKYLCDNVECPVISVWPEHGYLGSDRVVRDAAMLNAKTIDISRIAGR